MKTTLRLFSGIGPTFRGQTLIVISTFSGSWTGFLDRMRFTLNNTVEIGYQSIWFSVSFLFWSDKNAEVVCRQKRLPTDLPRATSIKTTEELGFMVDRHFKCTGSESYLYQCPYETWSDLEPQNYEYQAGVECSRKTMFHIEVFFFKLHTMVELYSVFQ